MRNVAVDDVIDITRRDGRHFRYRADSSAVVHFDASAIDPATERFELVLITCWPFDAVMAGPERYILHAVLIDPDC
ncbi:sortase [Bradyrhizobium sp. 180]|nr:sortase [Bradyrhizobium sp. CW12]MCK1494072.1 sortase [Bradyrhizobium sp. 180]MCK1532180.1 sortase [Bradyrhizobium sp. 182]MCK1594514.1 sortase [Bradyrhizobium sp. 164]MCK1618134.1 sortase [Bradyrhizobium sp. 159]MCK1644373.1 sortase [Bradyrhizobium sp. 154]MCK1665422.1 sortase [Bradyrhizobium sp. 153]